jgi:putative hydrolase
MDGMSQEPFGDIPLFRELQRLLSAGDGPINVEIARQVAGAVAGQESEPPLDKDAERVVEETLSSVERLLAGYTRLPLTEPLKGVLMTRRDWAIATLDQWSWLFEKLSARFSGQLEVGEPSESQSMQPVVAQVVPLLLGLQVGSMVGQLSLDTISRYDLPIPRDDARLHFIHTNVRLLAMDYGFEVDALYRWLVLREAAHHLVAIGVPWFDKYLRSLIVDVIDSIEIEMSELENRFLELQANMEDIQSGPLSRMLPLSQTEKHQRALRRLQGLLAILEGYALHATQAVEPSLPGADPRIDEAMARRRLSPSDGRALMSNLLGISIDRTLGSSGTTFCAAIVKLRGIDVLNRVWDAPDNLPSLDEIKDPFAWIERVDAE